MFCPVCNSEIKDDLKFCIKCGYEIPRCPGCGMPVLKKTRFCIYDGTPLPDELLSRLPEADTRSTFQNSSYQQPQENIPPANTGFCLQCGKPVYDGEALCTQCRQVYANSEFGSQNTYTGNTQYIPNPTQNYGSEYGYNQYNPASEYNYNNTGYNSYGYEYNEPEKKSGKTLLIILIILAAVIVVLAGIFAFLFFTDHLSFGNKSGSEGSVITETEEEAETRTEEESEEETETQAEEESEEETTTQETETTTQETTEEETTDEEDDTALAVLEGDDAVQAFILNCDSVYFTQEDLEGWTAEMCRLARNGIYARHGRLFDDEELQAYFDSCDWYEGTIEPDDFSESVFNSIELANRDLIVAYEEEMGYR